MEGRLCVGVQTFERGLLSAREDLLVQLELHGHERLQVICDSKDRYGTRVPR